MKFSDSTFSDSGIYSQRSGSSELDLTPLINIIFLMLIFFMLAAAITPADDVAIEPVTSSSAKPAADNNRVVVNIDRDAAVTINDAQLTGEQVAAQFVELVQSNDKVMLSIKADAELPANVLVKLLADATNAGVESVAILTVRR